MKHFVPMSMLCLVACGPSAARVQEAKGAAYNAPFADVWSAVTDELRRFQFLEIEDPINGSARTNWRLIERTEDTTTPSSQSGSPSSIGSSQTTSGTAGSSAGYSQVQNPGLATYLLGGYYMRLMAKVKGPPWTVDLDGEAAQHEPGYAELIRFHHGVADEPTWVNGRIDNVRIAIHERLKQYAVAAPAGAGGSGARPKPQEETPWGALPDAAKGAVDVLTAVHRAAKDRKAMELKPDLAADVVWSAGAPPSAEVALAMWGADTEVLAKLARTLESGCGYLDKEDAIVCPAGAPTDAQPGPHAVFRRPTGDWKLVLFIGR